MENKDTKEYKYDAFISYRHAELDQFVAESLHNLLETFKVPRIAADSIKKQKKTKISRVFRDRDELPLSSNLSDNIQSALETSEYLIVICSPRTPESLWVQKEIKTFISLHGRDKVLAVLIEGEPDQAFPKELCFETIEKVMEDGTKVTVEQEVLGDGLHVELEAVDHLLISYIRQCRDVPIRQHISKLCVAACVDVPIATTTL